MTNWTFPAGTFTVPTDSNTKLQLVGAHPGAGVTTWSLLLDGVDCALAVPTLGPVLVVCRSTVAGLEAAKQMNAQLGLSRVSAVLVIADAAGRPARRVRHELTVIRRPVPLVEVPWIPALRGVTAVDVNREQLRKQTGRVQRSLTDLLNERKKK